MAGRKKLIAINGQVDGRFDVGGRRLVAVQVQRLMAYDVATGRRLPRSTLTPVIAHRVALAPNGGLAAQALYSGGDVTLRELATGTTVASLATRGHVVNDVAFSPSGRLLAGGTTDGHLLVWDVVTGSELALLPGHRAGVSSVSWSSDGKRLVSGSSDLTMLIWDAEPWLARTRHDPRQATAAELDAWWQELAAANARGHQAVRKLVQAPQDAVTLLRKTLRPSTAKELERMRTLVGDLRSDQFVKRQQAVAELEILGELALPLLEKALGDNPPLEVRLRVEKLLEKLEGPGAAPAVLQQLRALAVLELIGSVEARALVQSLAAGEPEAWLTRAARAVQQRLSK